MSNISYFQVYSYWEIVTKDNVAIRQEEEKKTKFITSIPTFFKRFRKRIYASKLKKIK